MEVKNESEINEDQMIGFPDVVITPNEVEEVIICSEVDRETTKTILEDVCTDFESMDVVKVDKSNKIVNLPKSKTASVKGSTTENKPMLQSVSDVVKDSEVDHSSNSIFRVHDSDILPVANNMTNSAATQCIGTSTNSLIQPQSNVLQSSNFIPVTSTEATMQVPLTSCENQNVSIVSFPNENIQSLAQLADAEIVHTADNSVSIIITNPRLIKVIPNTEDPGSTMTSVIDSSGNILEANFERKEDLGVTDPNAISSVKIQDISMDASVLDGNVQNESEVLSNFNVPECSAKVKRSRGRPRKAFEMKEETSKSILCKNKHSRPIYQPNPISVSRGKPAAHISPSQSGTLTKPRRISAKMKEMWAYQLQKNHRLVCDMRGCSQTFVTVANFQTHYKFCTGKKNLEHCLYCDSLIFSSNKAVLQHMTVEHPDKVEEYKAKYPELSSEYHEQDNLSSHLIVSEDENIAMNIEEITLETQKNIKKRKLSYKENALSTPKAILKHKMKSIKQTVNENIKEFKKCVRFDNIVDKINSVDDFSRVVENISKEEIERPRKEKKKRVLIPSYVEEKKYFEDDEDDFIDEKDQQAVNDERIHTKARMVLNLERYKRYKEYLKLTRDWSSERRTYSRSKGSETSLESSYLQVLQNEYIREMQQQHIECGSESANISLDYSQMCDNSQIEINDMSSVETFQVVQTDKCTPIESNFSYNQPKSTSTPLAKNKIIYSDDISGNLNDTNSVAVSIPSTTCSQRNKISDPIFRNKSPNFTAKRIPCYNRPSLFERSTPKIESTWKKDIRVRNNIITYGVAIPSPMKKISEPMTVTFDSLVNSTNQKQNESAITEKGICNKREHGIKHPLKRRGRPPKVLGGSMISKETNKIVKGKDKNSGQKFSAAVLKSIEKNVRNRSAKLLKLKQTSKLKCDSRKIVRISQLRAKQQSNQRLQSANIVDDNECKVLKEETVVECGRNTDGHISFNIPENVSQIQCLATDHNYFHLDNTNIDPVNNVVREEEVISSNLEEINKLHVDKNATNYQLEASDCIQNKELEVVQSQFSKNVDSGLNKIDNEISSINAEIENKEIEIKNSSISNEHGKVSVAHNLQSVLEPNIMHNSETVPEISTNLVVSSPINIGKNKLKEKSAEDIFVEIEEISAEVDVISAKVQHVSSNVQNILVDKKKIEPGNTKSDRPSICNEANAGNSEVHVSVNDKNIVEEVKVKRGRGRPRKDRKLENFDIKNIRDQSNIEADSINVGASIKNKIHQENFSMQDSDEHKPVRKSERVKKRKLVDDEVFEVVKVESKKKDENTSNISVIRTGRRGRPRKYAVKDSEINEANVQISLQKTSELVTKIVTEDVSKNLSLSYSEVDAHNSLDEHSEAESAQKNFVFQNLVEKQASETKIKDKNIYKQSRKLQNNLQKSSETEAKFADDNIRKSPRKNYSKNDSQKFELEVETNDENLRKYSRKGRPRKCVRYADLNSGIDSSESLDGLSSGNNLKEKDLTSANDLQNSCVKDKEVESIVLPLKKRKQRQNKKDEDLDPDYLQEFERTSPDRKKMKKCEFMEDEDYEKISLKTRNLRNRRIKKYPEDHAVESEEKDIDGEVEEIDESNENCATVKKLKDPISRRIRALLASKSQDKEFSKGSYSHSTRCLFPDFQPKLFMWRLLRDSEYLDFLPPLKNSVLFKIEKVQSTKRKSKHAESEDGEAHWTNLSCFDSLPIDNESCHSTFFTGGPILCSAWCPTPHNEKKNQYIALAIRSSLNKWHSYNCTEAERGLLQLWNVGFLTNKRLDSKPIMELGISHNHGLISAMDWCPSGCWEDPFIECSGNSLPRLGLLAIACSDSYIRIYSVPHPNTLPKKSICFPLYSSCPSILLKPMYGGICLATMKSTCICVTWQKTDNCERIAGGYGNGMICIWLINSSATILTSKGNDQTTISPYLIFNAHGTPVTSLSFSSVPGARFLLSSSADKSVKFWDLFDTSLPIYSLRKGGSRSAKWTPGICGANVSLDHGLISFKGGTFFKEFGMEIFSARSCENPCFSVLNNSLSEWLNAEAMADASGLLSVNFLQGFIQDHCRCPMFFNRVIYQVKMQLIENAVEKIPVSYLINNSCTSVIQEIQDILTTMEIILKNCEKMRYPDILKECYPSVVITSMTSNHNKKKISGNELEDSVMTDATLALSQSVATVSLLSDIKDVISASANNLEDVVLIVSAADNAVDIISVIEDMRNTVPLVADMEDVISVVMDMKDIVSHLADVKDVVAAASTMNDVVCVATDIKDIISVKTLLISKVAKLLRKKIHHTKCEAAKFSVKMCSNDLPSISEFSVNFSEAEHLVGQMTCLVDLVSDLREIVCTVCEISIGEEHPLTAPGNQMAELGNCTKRNLRKSLNQTNICNIDPPLYCVISDILNGLIMKVSKETANCTKFTLSNKVINRTSVSEGQNNIKNEIIVKESIDNSKVSIPYLKMMDLENIVEDMKDIVSVINQISLNSENMVLGKISSSDTLLKLLTSADCQCLPSSTLLDTTTWYDNPDHLEELQCNSPLTQEVFVILSNLVKNVIKISSDKNISQSQKCLNMMYQTNDNPHKDLEMAHIKNLLSDIKDVVCLTFQLCGAVENEKRSNYDEMSCNFAKKGFTLQPIELKHVHGLTEECHSVSSKEVSEVLENLVKIISEEISQEYVNDIEYDEMADVPMVIDFKDNVMLEPTLPSYSSDSFPPLELAVFSDISCSDPFNELTSGSLDSPSFPPMLTACHSDVPPLLQGESVENDPPELQNETDHMLSIDDESSSSENEMDSEEEGEIADFAFGRESNFSDDSYLSECSLESNISAISTSESIMSEISSSSFPGHQGMDNLDSIIVNRKDSDNIEDINSSTSCINHLVSDMLNHLSSMNNLKCDSVDIILENAKSNSITPSVDIASKKSSDIPSRNVPVFVSADFQSSSRVPALPVVEPNSMDNLIMTEICSVSSPPVENIGSFSEMKQNSLPCINSEVDVPFQYSSANSDNAVQISDSISTDKSIKLPLSSSSADTNIIYNELCTRSTESSTVDKVVDVCMGNTLEDLFENGGSNESVELLENCSTSKALVKVPCDSTETVDTFAMVENNKPNDKRLLTYESVVAEHGLIFKDMNSADFENIEEISDDTNTFPLDKYHLASLNTVSWNPNFGSHFWLFSGGQSGIARLSYVSEINRDKYFRRN